MELQSIAQDQSHLSYTDKNATVRAEALADRMIKANQELTLGIPTGIPILDSVTGGWLPGQFASIIGRMNEGKSWLLMAFCVEAYKHGAKILFLSPEMTKDETELRFDTLMSRRFKNTDLTLGKPTIDVEEYKDFLTELEERSDWITYDSVPGGKSFTVSNIQALVNLHKPDLLAIDGIPLIGDDLVGSESWQKMLGVCYGLKGIAVNHGVIVLSTSQANRDSAQYKGIPKLENISYGEALAQAADAIVSLRLVKPTRVKIGMPKNRGGKIIGEFYLNFDVDNGIIEQLSDEVEAITDEEVFGGGFNTKDML
jgi:replicative DNA helicase